MHFGARFIKKTGIKKAHSETGQNLGKDAGAREDPSFSKKFRSPSRGRHRATFQITRSLYEVAGRVAGVVPCFSDSLSLSMLIHPPCPSTNCFATNSPIPLPTVVRVVKKASKTGSSRSARFVAHRECFRSTNAYSRCSESQTGMSR